jgi:plastocyanin
VNVGKTGNFFSDAETGGIASSIHVGDTIKWVWFDGPHSTTSGMCTPGGYYGGDGSCSSDGVWDSGLKSPTFSFSQKFNTLGTFAYFCDKHLNSMTGVIQVQP